MANIYDWQVGPNGELINTGSPDYGAPPPAKPSWNPPDRISSGINAPSPSLLSGAGSDPNMGYPAQGLTLNTSGPDSGLDQSAPPTATPNPGGSLDFSRLLNSINPISSAEAATLPQKQPYGPQVPPGGLPGQQPGAVATALAAAHRFANRLGKTSSHLGGLWNQIGNAPAGVAAVEGGNPAVANPPGPTNPIPATALPQPDRPYRAQAPLRQAPGGGGGSWVGSPNMNDAALGDQIMGGNMFGGGAQQRAPVQGPMAAFAPQASSPFTMVMRPNADPTNSRGGTPLATALDLSGYQPPPPPAPPSYNLGYGGGGRGGPAPAPAPRPFRAQAPPAWKGFPQVQKGGVAVTPPTWWNPATGGSTVGMGN